jgi:hypothetical protein
VDAREGLRTTKLAYFGEHALRYLLQGARLRNVLGSYDAVFAQRGAYPMGPAWILQALDGYRGRVVFDLDDDVFAVSPGLAARSPAARWLYGPQQAEFLLRRADAVIVSTPTLDAALPGRRADAVLPTVPDASGWPVVTHTSRLPIRVGWAGNAGNLIYLDPLRDVFDRLRRDGIAELEVLSSQPWDGPAAYRRWRRADEPAVHATWDVGIMPLPDTRYTRAKAGFKLLLYMAAGSAVVASPVGINATLIDQSGAGVAATTPQEWESALRMLAARPDIRAEMGRAGAAFLREYANADEQAATIARLLRGESRPPGPA